MSRIAACFARLRDANRGALITFLEAYDPDPATSLAILRGMPAAGADIIEVGMPFTDPMADGPTVQAAGQRALKAGATLAKTLAMVRDFRKHDATTPIVLMGYLNPIDSYGVTEFCRDAEVSGVDGLIIVDLPTEESDLILPHSTKHNLDFIRLIAPTTDEARLPVVLNGSSGFVYYVSITGITGTRVASADEFGRAVPVVRKHTDLPIAIGFGVRTPEQAANAVRAADAAVVGSALIDTMVKTLDENGRAGPETVSSVLALVRDLANGIRGARSAA